jgi:hypothetical protein
MTDFERTKQFLDSIGIEYMTNKNYPSDVNDTVIRFTSTSSEWSAIEDAIIKVKFDESGKFLTVVDWE